MKKIFDKFKKNFNNLFNMNKITINGQAFNVDGNNVTVKSINCRSKITVNGVVIADNLEGDVIIKWEGDLANLDCVNAEISGNVNGKVDATNITCNNITGDVNSTSIECNDIKGDINSTSVECSNITGNVKALSVDYK